MRELIMMYLPDAGFQEAEYLEMKLAEVDESKHKHFLMSYKAKKQSEQNVLICALVGLIAVAGIQRFLIGQIGMGILYLLTGGLCLIGTIMDAINHKSLAWEYNRKMIDETARIYKNKL